MFAEFLSGVMRAPYRFLIAAAVLATILCLFPARVEEENPQLIAVNPTAQPQIVDLPAGRVPSAAQAALLCAARCARTAHNTVSCAACIRRTSVQTDPRRPADHLSPAASLWNFLQSSADFPLPLEPGTGKEWPPTLPPRSKIDTARASRRKRILQTKTLISFGLQYALQARRT